LTLDAIGEMFGSARAIMAWLADCARVVSASNAPVSWSSPLGLPIMQPYHKLVLTNIQTATQSFAVRGQGTSAVL
jgi:DNA-directed RNA polymerase